MNPLSTGPLDVLRALAAFWDLEYLLICETLSRRWHDAMQDPSLWAELDIPSRLCSIVGQLLARHGKWVCRLTVAYPLCHNGLRSNSFMRCCSKFSVTSLRKLEIQYASYFILNPYSHQTGARLARLRLAWVLEHFPDVQSLSCDYLELDHRGPPPEAFHHLAFVALVREEEEQEELQWNTRSCGYDFSALSTALPHLKSLEIKHPRLSLGRISRREGMTTEDLQWQCRRFCAVDLEQLSGICVHFQSLQSLEIATVCSSDSFLLEGSGLVEHLTVLSRSGERIRSSCTGLDLRMGVGASHASHWRSLASRSLPTIKIEIVSVPDGSPVLSRPAGIIGPQGLEESLFFPRPPSLLEAAGLSNAMRRSFAENGLFLPSSPLSDSSLDEMGSPSERHTPSPEYGETLLSDPDFLVVTNPTRAREETPPESESLRPEAERAHTFANPISSDAEQ